LTAGAREKEGLPGPAVNTCQAMGKRHLGMNSKKRIRPVWKAKKSTQWKIKGETGKGGIRERGKKSAQDHEVESGPNQKNAANCREKRKIDERKIRCNQIREERIHLVAGIRVSKLQLPKGLN